MGLGSAGDTLETHRTIGFHARKIGGFIKVNQKGLSLFLHTANKIIVHAKPVRRKLEYLPVVATV